MRSRAQVSDAGTCAPFARPRTSGRKPCGSRTPRNLSVERKTSEYAPRTSRSASTTRSSSVSPWDAAIRWMMTSLSTVDWKIEPRASSRSRSSSAFTRLPLCATARPPRPYSTTSGWAFFRCDAPAVERRPPALAHLDDGQAEQVVDLQPLPAHLPDRRHDDVVAARDLTEPRQVPPPDRDDDAAMALAEEKGVGPEAALELDAGADRRPGLIGDAALRQRHRETALGDIVC